MVWRQKHENERELEDESVRVCYGKLGKGMDRLNIFVMPDQRKPGYTFPRR